MRRDYRGHDGEKLPGVTTIIGLLNKPALVGWAAKLAAETAVRAKADGHTDEIAIKRGTAAPNLRRDGAADAGTSAHALVEARLRGEHVALPDTEIGACARRILDHLARTGTTAVHVEVPISDPDGGYGGTIDYVLERDGVLLLGDLKTGKGAYDEAVIQLAAYRELWHLEHPLPPIQGAIVVHAPMSGDVVEYEIDSERLDAGRDIFRALLSVHRQQKHLDLKGAKR